LERDPVNRLTGDGPFLPAGIQAVTGDLASPGEEMDGEVHDKTAFVSGSLFMVSGWQDTCKKTRPYCSDCF